MASRALTSFLDSLDEVSHLGSASHPKLGPSHPGSLKLARAVGRSQIVLLSSHFERYIYALNGELVAYLNSAHISGDRLPANIRLLHSMSAIDELGRTGWEQRANNLETFIVADAWLWSSGVVGSLDHTRLLAWMKTPSPDSLRRYFKIWGIDDIFSAVTRFPRTRSELWLNLRGLVELRNNIAHGDYGAQATQDDVKRYVYNATTFCERADRKLADQIARSFDIDKPW